MTALDETYPRNMLLENYSSRFVRSSMDIDYWTTTLRKPGFAAPAPFKKDWDMISDLMKIAVEVMDEGK